MLFETVFKQFVFVMYTSNTLIQKRVFPKYKQFQMTKKLVEILIYQNNCLIPNVSEVARVLKLFLIIPVISAMTECFFSRLILIKK